MKLAKLLVSLGAIAMGTILIYGFAVGDFASEGSQLLSMPWGVVSLVDLYVGFTLFSCWIVFREGVCAVSLVWTVAVMTLGSFAICVYVLLALQSSRQDWAVFFLGRHVSEMTRR